MYIADIVTIVYIYYLSCYYEHEFNLDYWNNTYIRMYNVSSS